MPAEVRLRHVADDDGLEYLKISNTGEVGGRRILIPDGVTDIDDLLVFCRDILGFAGITVISDLVEDAGENAARKARRKAMKEKQERDAAVNADLAKHAPKSPAPEEPEKPASPSGSATLGARSSKDVKAGR